MNIAKITLCFALVLTGNVVCSERNTEEADMIHYLSTNANLQGKAEIVFLLDRSGSVGKADFETELGFVESFLTHIMVDVNASRVAVISYSDTATKHIDYLKEPKTKCFFAQEMRDVVYENSAATNIEAAFEEARNVFANARPNINKVAVLISDGFYTKGGDPAAIADTLKAEGVEIFCFGVGKFLQTELERLASSQEHVYTCSGFKEFKTLARKIRGDPHESRWSSQTSQPNCDHLCDSLYKGDPNDPGCCDLDARCSCALKSGLHTCVCKPGFYGLSGLAGDCRACPRGTYKSKLEPSNTCTPCPPGSITAEIGSRKLSDCYCREGFAGDPFKGIPCEMVKCPSLQSPTNGYTGLCDTVYGSTCHFMCEDGYDLTDTSSESRTCKSNGEWTGTTAVCREIRCNPLRQPTYGSMHCEPGPFTVGKKCSFSCSRGYIIEGSHLRECTSSKQWTGKDTSCIPTTCELPPKLVNGKYHLCDGHQKPNYSDTCFPYCHRGFDLRGPNSLTCTEHGKLLDGYGKRTTPECLDMTPPEINCGKSIRVETDKGKNTAMVTWEEPLATDNTGWTPKLILSPSHITQNYAFPIGYTRLTYTAVDQAGLSRSCSLLVQVVDSEPPIVVKCPENIEVSAKDDVVQVFWEEPQFEDNSKKPVRIIYQSYESGDTFGVGSRTVKYIAEDESRNRRECEFSIVVSHSRCKYFPPPNNGAMACDYLPRGYFCQVFCEDQYDFQRTPANFYVCNQRAEWQTLDPFEAPIPWPDCSRMVVPGAVQKKVGFYYKGDCQDPGVQRAIKKMFRNHLSSRIKEAEICFGKGSCSIDSVKVLCGAMTERRKRDVWQQPGKEQLELEFEITIDADQQLNDTQALMQDFLDILNNLQWDFEDDENVATTTPTPAESASLERKVESLVQNEDETILVCKIGSVIKDETCVLCSAGTFYDTTRKECLDCPVGSYQEQDGQLECEKCPEGTSTEHAKSKNETLCKGICTPGTYSSTGLETCLACPIGTFQNSAGMTSCNSCPIGTITANVGAVSLDDCKDICPPGTFSPNSLEPCELCPLHHYQPEAGKLHCLECPGQLLTAEKGAANVDECLDVDPCIIFDSCQNNGRCIKAGRIAKCDCQQGFEGDHCEKDTDECSSTPCSNGAACINVEGSFFCNCSDGFGGKLCDVEIDECASSPCQNGGTCIDQLNGYKCVCSDNFEGGRCDVKRELCFRDVVCLNGGVCVPGGGDSSCVCEPGFAGIDCSQNINECDNVTCQNNGSCIDGINSFTCACNRGHKGTLCEINIDECENNLCHGESLCQDLVDGYECICPPGWNGTYCDTKMNSDFILMFPDSAATIANMATMTLNSSLTDATVSLWVQTNDTERSGTPLSYAVASTKSFNADGMVVDNALTISDCSEIKIYVNNEPVMTDLQVADGQWHHLAFTWSSKNSGMWALYKDGELKYEGKNLRSQEVINGGGSVIIGQEQDNLGGGFSPLETFTGNITRVNIWNSYFSRTNITKLCNMDDDLPEKVLAWPDFLNGLKGNVQVIQNSKPTISK